MRKETRQLVIQIAPWVICLVVAIILCAIFGPGRPLLFWALIVVAIFSMYRIEKTGIFG